MFIKNTGKYITGKAERIKFLQVIHRRCSSNERVSRL